MSKPKGKRGTPPDKGSIAVSSPKRKGRLGVDAGKLRGSPGPEPERLVLDGDWKDAVKIALTKNDPPPKKKSAKKRR